MQQELFLINEYLETVIKNYNFSSSNSYLELKRSFLDSDLEYISINEKKNIIHNIEEIHVRGDTISSISSTTCLIKEIQKQNFPNKDKMAEIIKISEYQALSGELSFKEFADFIEAKVHVSNQFLEKKEQIIINSFLFTLEASAYFWFPSEMGGSGIGYSFLEKLAEKENRRIPWYGAALIADAASLSIGMVAVAISGLWVPVIGWTALAIVAGEAALNSGIAGLIAWGTQ